MSNSIDMIIEQAKATIKVAETLKGFPPEVALATLRGFEKQLGSSSIVSHQPAAAKANGANGVSHDQADYQVTYRAKAAARKLKVDFAAVQAKGGSGRGGLVTSRDVRAFAATLPKKTSTAPKKTVKPAKKGV